MPPKTTPAKKPGKRPVSKAKPVRKRPRKQPTRKAAKAQPAKIPTAPNPVPVAPRDVGIPLRNARHEGFSQDVVAGMFESDAYRKWYPHCQGWKPESIHTSASRLCAKVAPRVNELKEHAAATAIITFEERKALLCRLILDAAGAQILKATGQGDAEVFLSEKLIRNSAIKRFSKRVSKEGALHQRIEIRDLLPYLQELNKMEGVYPARTHKIEGDIGLAALIREITGGDD